MALNLIRFSDESQAAQALADAVARDLHTALSTQARALLLVSGGRSPLAFFARLAEQDLAWERVDVSLVDERSVPLDHPDSNSALVRRHLLTGRAQAARWLPLVAQDFAGQDGLAQAQQAAQAANANPDLQAPAVIVLGLGTDGHTASLFPDAPEWQQACTTQERYVVTQPVQAPHARVGLSLKALIAQQKSYVWSGGVAKLETLNRAKILAVEIAQGQAGAAALLEAGPLALLIAQPKVILHVIHNDN